MLGKPANIHREILDQITLFNDVRGDLTHPKNQGRDIYANLETINPLSVIDTIAEYIVRFHEAEGTTFPYWLFGWNYLNPRPNSYEIQEINDGQFCFSLQALGFQVEAASPRLGELWQTRFLGTFEGYVAVKQTLSTLSRCEPKFDEFPYKPILCCRWWTREHHQSCGHVSDDAIEYALNYRT